MTYDELEEQYFKTVQQNKELKIANTALEDRNYELEMSQVSSENRVTKLKNAATESKVKIYEDSVSLANLRVSIQTLQSIISNLENSAGSNIAATKSLGNEGMVEMMSKQANVNDRDFGNLLHGTIYNPMGRISMGSDQKSIIIPRSDVFSLPNHNHQGDMSSYHHLFAEIGNKVVRYSGTNLLELERKEDFFIALHQMLDGFRNTIIREYAKTSRFTPNPCWK
jgi:hypothetical protein